MTDKIAYTLVHEIHFTPTNIQAPGTVILLDPAKDAARIAELLAADAIRESTEDEKAKVGLTRGVKPVTLGETKSKVDPKDEV